MNTYLVGLSYHYPDDLKRWKEGVIEDFEASTGIFIKAQTEKEAIEWAQSVARAFHAQENPDDPDSWDKYSHHCWIEEDADTSGWQHCLPFLQRINHGEMPRLQDMNSKAYREWKRKSKSTG